MPYSMRQQINRGNASYNAGFAVCSTGKKVYLSRQEALWDFQGPARATSYRCGECNYWHRSARMNAS